MTPLFGPKFRLQSPNNLNLIPFWVLVLYLALNEVSSDLKLSSYPSKPVCSPVGTWLPFRTKIFSVQHCTSLLTPLFPHLREERKLPIWGLLTTSPKALSQMDLHLAGHQEQTSDIHIFNSPRPYAHLAVTLSSKSVLRDHLRNASSVTKPFRKNLR